MGVQRILLTPGEPAGIGPELAVRVAQQAQDYELLAICDADLLRETASTLKLPLELRETSFDSQAAITGAFELACLPVKLAAPVNPGQLDLANADYVVKCLQLANDACLSGAASAVVTGPVQKSVINEAGLPFSGHTEFFAEKSAVTKVVMMLATEGLRVALVTTHLPLKDVADAITAQELTSVIEILHRELSTKFGIAKPKIFVCGLNPPCGRRRAFRARRARHY